MTVIALLIVALVWGLGRLLHVLNPVLWPLAVAAILACLLDPLVDWFERKQFSRVQSIACVFGIAILILTAVFGSVVPRIVSEMGQLVKRIPVYSIRLENSIEYWLKHPNTNLGSLLMGKPEINPSVKTTVTTNQTSVITNTTPAIKSGTDNLSLFNETIDQKTLQSAKNWLILALPAIGHWLFGEVVRVASWFGILVELALIPVYAFYFLLEKDGIQKHWKDYLPVQDSRLKEEIIFIISAVEQYLIAFFRGQVLVAICGSVVYTIGFLCLGLNYAFLLGFAALLLLIVPFLGAIILCIMALTLTFVQYGDWLHPLLVLGLFAVAQTLENLLISPKIMGDRVGLHPLAIIVAVVAGTTLLGGLLGGILAIPLAAALRVIMFHYVWKKPNGATL
ncbi:MAG TPA: AI-2E family transporter [Candidatus Saccharimonadales bacterium]|nr:AI-2E family transporter [Candidatus Saccharimonadales bacterium]